MGSPIFTYEFFNSADLLAAINRIGPEALCETLFSHRDDDIFSSFGDYSARIKKLLVKTVAPLFGEHLRMDDLYRSVHGMLDEHGYLLAIDNPVVFDKINRQLAFVAADIFMLDRQPAVSVEMIDLGRIDMDYIRLLHQKALADDPAFIADQFLRRVAGYHGNAFDRPERVEERVEELAYLSLGRIALKECRRDILWCLKQDPAQVRHVIDWIVSAVVNNAEWLSNLDDLGRPKKLMKFGSLGAMVVEADKAMRLALSKERASIGETDETVFADDGGDYRIVRLKTPRSLDVESGEMRHCVGHGSYDHRLADPDYFVLSLRDRRNYPHATIEVRAGRIIQFRGKANHKPKPVYRDAAVRLLEPHGIEFLAEPPENPWVNIGAGDLQAWQRVHARVLDLFAAAPLAPIDQTREIRLI